MTTGAQLTFLGRGLAAGALENMASACSFAFCGSVTFRRLAGANAGRLPLPQLLTQDEKLPSQRLRRWPLDRRHKGDAQASGDAALNELTSS
jgi:hypothetical protein